MKFFFQLGFRYGEGNLDSYYHLGVVYGPYDDDRAVAEALARLWPNEKEERFLVFEGQIVSVKPSPKEKPEDEKRTPGNMENYVWDGACYRCKECNGPIRVATVAHPIHLREMPGGGFGECQYENVSYCPNCEKKPSFHGEPVYTTLQERR